MSLKVPLQTATPLKWGAATPGWRALTSPHLHGEHLHGLQLQAAVLVQQDIFQCVNMKSSVKIHQHKLIIDIYIEMYKTNGFYYR